MSHAAQSPPDDRFVIAQRGERLHIKQLNTAGLKQRRKIARIVIGREHERTERRHLAGVQRMLKFRSLLFFLGGVDFSAFNSLAQYPLERCQDLIAPVRLLVMLLIIVEPECGVNSDKTRTNSAVQRTRRPPKVFRLSSIALSFSLHSSDRAIASTLCCNRTVANLPPCRCRPSLRGMGILQLDHDLKGWSISPPRSHPIGVAPAKDFDQRELEHPACPHSSRLQSVLGFRDKASLSHRAPRDRRTADRKPAKLSPQPQARCRANAGHLCESKFRFHIANSNWQRSSRRFSTIRK